MKRINQKKKIQLKEKPDSDSLYFKDIEDDLARLFGTRVTIQRKDKKGKLFFEFYNDDDLDRLLGMLKK
ncbi:hypothetical protein [Desulfosarcina sp. BuS5]|uniref:hypothetical protein n=1 Tax=Desulfosarcina sp. BuS5 TaxID=933262 RepID=UPI003FCE5203